MQNAPGGQHRRQVGLECGPRGTGEHRRRRGADLVAGEHPAEHDCRAPHRRRRVATIYAERRITGIERGRGLGRAPFVDIQKPAQAARSKRSAFITLFQAATKSLTNFSFASDAP